LDAILSKIIGLGSFIPSSKKLFTKRKMMLKKLVLSLTVALMTVTIGFGQSEWALDKAHSKIRFAVTHMGISETEGQFNEFDGSVMSSSDDFDGATVMFTAKTSSVDTDNERRDGHLRSDDFFNAEMYPELKFEGKIVKEGEKHWLVGNMTIRDVTKEEKFAVKHNGTINGRRGPLAGFQIDGVINRFDYNLKFNRTIPGGDLVVGKDVSITAKVEINGPAPEGDGSE
jgi:polyisoprenoid-binding protein YceI